MNPKYSFIIPCEEDRLPLFYNTLEKYNSFSNIGEYEIIVPSRTLDSIPGYPNIKVIRYEYEGDFFSPVLAWNAGVREATHDNIIITCPEVMPKTNVLKEIGELERGNYLCQVFDANKDGSIKMSLVNSKFRGDTMAMHFLGIFKKEDIYKVNGWNEDYVGGHGFEDDSMGWRMKMSGIKHKVLDHIQGIHQWHERYSMGSDGAKRNREVFNKEKESGLLRCKRGLIKDE